MPSTAVRTPIFQVPELCGRYGGADVLVADMNAGRGTAKGMRDRELMKILETTQSGRQHTVFVQITCGNSGYDLGMEAREAQKRTGRRIDVVNLVAKGTSPAIKKKLAECSFVHEMDLGHHVTMAEMRKIAKEATGYEGPEEDICGVERYNLRGGYRAVVRQMAEEGLKPTHIFVPVGGGELLTEIAAEAENVWGDGLPKIVGVTVKQNVLVHKEDFIRNPGKSIADKLVCGYSKFKELVKEFVRRGVAELKVVGDRQIYDEYTYLNGIEPAEPSAAVAFAGAKAYGLKLGDTAVILNTGMGIYDAAATERFFRDKLFRKLRKIGAVAAGAFLALGLAFYGYTKWNEKQERVERELAFERNMANSAWNMNETDSAMRAASGRMRGYTVQEAQQACELLGKPRDVCENYYDQSKFTPLEIYFLGQVYNLSLDNWAREDRQKLIESWRNGTYAPGEYFYRLHPEALPSER
ncbi:MAG: pyridoxal-phosphate dependent enzyme [Candidatus ainarchaeum sp.]|nr:pyridoxal-phosphate dependent enzyme [Candidatus ainarchaeum sp.]MDD5096605.1 pyridoxal-phosphate dependent enzyme [Candidatus ainarchaeum sp.]